MGLRVTFFLLPHCRDSSRWQGATLLSRCDISPLRGIPSTVRSKQVRNASRRIPLCTHETERRGAVPLRFCFSLLFRGTAPVLHGRAMLAPTIKKRTDTWSVLFYYLHYSCVHFCKFGFCFVRKIYDIFAYHNICATVNLCSVYKSCHLDLKKCVFGISE